MTLPEEHAQTSRKVSVDIVTRNEIVDWSTVVEPYVFSLTAICLQKVKALSISGNKFRWLLEDNHGIGDVVRTGLIKIITSRLVETRRLLVSERLLTPILKL